MHRFWSSRQSGTAILSAMLTVTLVAGFAASALLQQWRITEVEAAERARLQAHWILGGALDWARLILTPNTGQSTVDHLSQPWAVPLEEARLSTFLAAAQSDVLEQGLPDVFLSGRITDLQSRLNISNLVQGGVVDPASKDAFARLFRHLGISPVALDQLIVQLQRAQKTKVASDTDTPLLPQEFDQLGWLGLQPGLLNQLRGFVTLLPSPTPVNLNTAPAEVIYAVVNGFDWANAQQFVRQRDQKHLNTLSDAQGLSPVVGAHFNDNQHAVKTRYFEVLGQLRNGDVVTREQSLLERNGSEIKILARHASALTGVIASKNNP